jgi:hypothetical protein
MGDVHTLAGYRGRANDEVIKSDNRFDEYKQKVADAKSLTILDAMITQLINYKTKSASGLKRFCTTIPCCLEKADNSQNRK